MKTLFFSVVIGIAIAANLTAHVVVKPSDAGLASTQNFVVGVPNEKDLPTVGLRLVVPAGLTGVTPLVKAGWSVEIKKTGDQITELVWTGGSIPKGFRDEFAFRAKVPASATSLFWKAYQTYQGGVTVAWDQDPNELKTKDAAAIHAQNLGPYSVTKVLDDLGATAASVSAGTKGPDWLTLGLALGALALAGSSLVITLVRKRSN